MLRQKDKDAETYSVWTYNTDVT